MTKKLDNTNTDGNVERHPTSLLDVLVPIGAGNIGLVYGMTTAPSYGKPIIVLVSTFLLALSVKILYNYVQERRQ